MSIWNVAFWKDSLDRAIATAAQFTIGGLALGEGVNAFNVDWQLGIGFAVTGFALSTLTSVARGGVRTARN